MNRDEFFLRLDATIAKYDLLRHPFYRAWTDGKLTREDLRDYARAYFHHVNAFPGYLNDLAERLSEGELRRAVLANMADEMGTSTAAGGEAVTHAELWLDFTEEMGATRHSHEPPRVAEVEELISTFRRIASSGTAAEALAAFYAYESQVPGVAAEKARGLRDRYGANDRTRRYFTLHATADIYHSRVWRRQLEKELERVPEESPKALEAAETAAQALWRALDGIEAQRVARTAA